MAAGTTLAEHGRAACLTTPPDNSFDPTALSAPLVNLACCDVARLLSSGGGLIRALGRSAP